jgi:hypothetical protein
LATNEDSKQGVVTYISFFISSYSANIYEETLHGAMSQLRKGARGMASSFNLIAVI